MNESSIRPFTDASHDPFVRGFLHQPESPNGDGLVLTHGAGSNCQTSLLKSLAEAFAGTGLTVLRVDLPYRQDRPFGPPTPGAAARDRDGLKQAVRALRSVVSGRLVLGGHSYGGRQATMLCADDPKLVAGLVLFSYPLHPPKKPEQLRTQHFPKLKTPSLFVQGTRDPFGSIAEMESALKLISAKNRLLAVDGAGHDLGFKGKLWNEELLTSLPPVISEFFAE